MRKQMKGRPRKPTKTHELEGTTPEFDHSNEPKDLEPLGDYPEHWDDEDPVLRDGLVKIWYELRDAVPKGVITNSDRHHLEIATGLLWQWRNLSPGLGKPRCGFGGLSSANLGLLEKHLSKLGMNPSDRSRVSAAGGGEGKPKDGWDDI